MSKLRAMTAIAALSLVAACNETYVAHNTTRVSKTPPIQTTQEWQPSPWMQVMQRFGALKPAGSVEARLERRLLEIAQTRAGAPSGRLFINPRAPFAPCKTPLSGKRRASLVQN